MFDTFTVSFFGHRYIDNYFAVEKKLEELVRELLMTKTYVEFLIGRDGEFDQIVASTVKTVKRSVGDSNSALVWVMAYPKAEYPIMKNRLMTIMMRSRSVRHRANVILSRQYRLETETWLIGQT